MKIAILNNWDGLMHFFHRYIDHDQHEVWYVCDEKGEKGVRTFLGAEHQTRQVRIDKLDDERAVIEALRGLRDRVAFERIVAVDEFTVLPAARARDALGIPGPGALQVECYRDKRRMKEVLAAAGIRVIRDLSPATIMDAFVPCVVKALHGAAAMGVHVCRTRAELEPRLEALAGGALLEEYVEGDFFHVDGAFDPDGVVAMPHAYVNDCYAHYVTRTPLGSIGVDDEVLRGRLVELAGRVVRALPLPTGVFHLEVIRTPDDQLVFLEIACRLGGGEIYQNFIDTYGLDLLGFHIAAELGAGPALTPLRRGDVAGWLMLNNFPHIPGVFTGLSARPLRPDTCAYGVRCPKLGRPIGPFDYVSFSLRGRSSDVVRAGIDDLIANVRLHSEAP